jgi:hypothetical protein
MPLALPVATLSIRIAADRPDQAVISTPGGLATTVGLL